MNQVPFLDFGKNFSVIELVIKNVGIRANLCALSEVIRPLIFSVSKTRRETSRFFKDDQRQVAVSFVSLSRFLSSLIQQKIKQCSKSVKI